MLVVAAVLGLAGLCLSGEPVLLQPSLDLEMPGARPAAPDSYLCSAFDVTALSRAANNMTALHVTGFVPHAEANRAHHMLLYSCDTPIQQPGQVR